MNRILIVCDRPNWAYDAIAKALIRYNPDPSMQLDVFYIKGGGSLEEAANRYDLVFPMGWQVLGQLGFWSVKETAGYLDKTRTITGLHSHHSWDKHKTMPDNAPNPPRSLVSFLSKYKGVNAVSKRLYSLFKGAGLTNVVYTPNGADVNIFQPEKPLRKDGPLRVGYSGSYKHDWRKGISEFIEPACKAIGAELVCAMPVGGNYVPLDQMHTFYQDIDVYLCASSSEGFSLSVLEASSCGRPVISTRVGGCDELIIDGENGYLVDRTVAAMVEKLRILDRDRDLLVAMGSAMRKCVEDKWSWNDRAIDWIDFMKHCLDASNASLAHK